MKKKVTKSVQASVKAAQDERVKQRAIAAVKGAMSDIDRDQSELIRVWTTRADVFETLVREDPKGEENAVHAARASELRRACADLHMLMVGFNMPADKGPEESPER